MAKPGRRGDLTSEEAEQVFLLAIDWGTYRTLSRELGLSRDEVRELAELYLGRFDERLERRLAEVDVRLERRLAELDVRLEQRLAERDVRLEQRLAERDVRLDQRLAELDGRLEQRFADVRVEMGDRLSAHYRDLHRWLFVLWAGTVIPLAGLMVALIKL